MNINFSTATRGKLHAPHIVSKWMLIPCLWMKRWANFPQATQVQFSNSNNSVSRTLCFLSQVQWTMRGLTQKVAGFPCNGWNSGSSFIWQGEGMSESPVETPEKAVGFHLIWTREITSLWHLKRHTEFNASKGDDPWLFLKMDRNPNITLPTRKLTSVSCLTSRSVRVVLPSVDYVHEVSIVTRQES